MVRAAGRVSKHMSLLDIGPVTHSHAGNSPSHGVGGWREDLPCCQGGPEVKMGLLFESAVWLAERGQPGEGCP